MLEFEQNFIGQCTLKCGKLNSGQKKKIYGKVLKCGCFISLGVSYNLTALRYFVAGVVFFLFFYFLICSNSIYWVGAKIKQTSKYMNKMNVLETINVMKKTKQNDMIQSTYSYRGRYFYSFA